MKRLGGVLEYLWEGGVVGLDCVGSRILGVKCKFARVKLCVCGGGVVVVSTFVPN